MIPPDVPPPSAPDGRRPAKAPTPPTALTAPAPGARPRVAASLGQALTESEPLSSLLARLAQSQARWQVVAAGLAPELAAAARPGPLDDQAWTILADHASAAAKLRQHLPDIAAALQAHGWLAPPVRIKVRPRGS